MIDLGIIATIDGKSSYRFPRIVDQAQYCANGSLADVLKWNRPKFGQVELSKAFFGIAAIVKSFDNDRVSFNHFDKLSHFPSQVRVCAAG
jgi:hypothetical protein